MVTTVRLAAHAVAVVGFLISASAALAQDMSQIIDRLNRLERDLADTQREVFRPTAKPRTGSVISTPLTPNAGAPASAGEVPLIARHEIRLQQLENQLRALTGRIEEFSFSINQFGKRLDRLVSDVDYRLQRLEAAQVSSGTGGQAAAGQAIAGSNQTAQSTAATPNGGRPVPPALGDNDGAVLDQQGTRALGQISASGAAPPPPRPPGRRPSRRRPPRKSPPHRRRFCRSAPRASATVSLSVCFVSRTTRVPRPLLRNF